MTDLALPFLMVTTVPLGNVTFIPESMSTSLAGSKEGCKGRTCRQRLLLPLHFSVCESLPAQQGPLAWPYTLSILFHTTNFALCGD